MTWIASIILIAAVFSVYYLGDRLDKAEKRQHEQEVDAKM